MRHPVALCREEALLHKIELLEEVIRLMPDEIEVFRIMQDTGGKRAEMAKAIGRRIEELRNCAEAIIKKG